MTSIEWTDETWNPVTGCDRCSPGCDNCYALTMAKRLKAMGAEKYQTDGDPVTSGPGFGVQCHSGSLDDPLRWRKPRRVFVNSMSDLFHPDVTDEFIADVYAVMSLAQAHTFQVLTKRSKRMRNLLSDPDFEGDLLHDAIGRRVDWMNDNKIPVPLSDEYTWPIRNVWQGVSVESNSYTFRADHLRATPAAVRFISAEPLLGRLDQLDLTDIDWLIVGGESGREARPMHPDWVRDLRDRCTATAFFFKQWGHWLPTDQGTHIVELDGTVREREYRPSRLCGPGAMVGQLGKKRAGRALDGCTWDEFPQVAR